jgi:hypothetical protein
MFKKTNTPGEITLISNDNYSFIEFQKKIQNKNEWEYISPTLFRMLNKNKGYVKNN